VERGSVALTIRHLTLADLDATDAVLMAAFAGARSRKLELVMYSALQPDGWLLAERDRMIVGVGGAVDYGPFAYVGLVGVHPSAQRQGIGLALMDRLLAWFDDRGCPVVLLDASDAGAPLYLRLGFVEDDQTAVYRREREGFFSAAEAAGVEVRPFTLDDLPAVAAFDAPCFAADRGSVFAALLDRYPARSFVTRDASDAVTGYLIAQPTTLGPWSAAAPEAGAALLAHALALPFDAPPGVIVSALNRNAAALLERGGFELRGTRHHMRRGGEPMLHRRALIYGQASLAIG
jgi:ribosomal protein S18 acetylase RimI-like enzyme